MILVDPFVDHSDEALQEAGLTCRMRRTSHLTSDTSLNELVNFARRIDMPDKWLHNDHYDVAPSYRARALAAGAVLVSAERLVCQRWSRKARYARRGQPHECICGECA